MNRRVHTADQFGGLTDWWTSLPPVTRLLGSTWLINALAAYLDLIPLELIYLDGEKIFKKFQLWRLLSNTSFLGSFSMHMAIRLLWLFTYSPHLERTMTEYSPGDYLFCILFCVFGIDILGMINPYVQIYFSSGPLIFAILYLWSREFAQQEVSIYGLIKIKAFFLPWAMLAIGIFLGGPPSQIMVRYLGIAVAHLYYFLKTIYPSLTGKHILRCPSPLHRFMSRFNKKSKPDPFQRGENRAEDNDERFRAFSGQARSLRD